jgi:DNA-binding IclR family transcriptional regulator
VRRFVAGNFDTVTAVEVLLLLHRERRAWTSAAVARSLRIDTDQTRNILDALSGSRLLRRRGLTFEYDPATPEIADVVERLAGLYPRYRYRISDLIFAR